MALQAWMVSVFPSDTIQPRLQVWSKTNLVDVHVRNPYRQGRQHGAICQFVFLKFYVLLKNQFKGSLKAQLYVCQFTVQGRLDTIT
jgi:hypothetical protein